MEETLRISRSTALNLLAQDHAVLEDLMNIVDLATGVEISPGGSTNPFHDLRGELAIVLRQKLQQNWNS